ncbi:hypothetical protein PFICI_09841 [Pestalotiopsis fici W106-1]|uniref:Protein kinase domain-containing protein n=1 Tax=Pestalotiopsis fici (strain W106-1 / CGMCC3.15140) TaxID=1229662 RepID=W3WVD9_PESFW|nr:uncharacterized protein PFICI_09841 [Pestalotiopsis fici W106-1]ETS77779.1 hypothetical protein PFICI_09841 [Pestalotiopsis fici W106-1]
MPVCSTTVDLPQDKRKVVRVKRRWRLRAKSLYVGIKNEIPPPPGRERFIQDEWNKVIKEELQLHLDNINREIRYTCQGKDTWKSILEPELLLTGYQIGKSISLSPKIWFRCGSAWTEKIVQKETGALSWMAERGLGDRIETGLKSAILVSHEPSPVPRQVQTMLDDGMQPTSELPYGYTLHICTEKLRVMGTVNGLLCSALVRKDGEVRYHSICRIGGLISINDGAENKIYAVTTAHGLLDYFLNADNIQNTAQSARPQLKSTTRLTEIASSFIGRRFNRSATQVAASAMQTADTVMHGTLSQQELDSVEWEPVRSVSATNWLGGGWEVGKEFQHPFFIPSPERLVPDADFALLELPSESYNTPQHTRTDDRAVHEIRKWLSDDQLDPGEVQVVLRSDRQVSAEGLVTAQLLYERPHLFLRGAPFPTRKLRLEKPLASGTSGAWVVRNHELCGMIVASYETEPFAHMITAEKLFSDIRKTLDIMPGQLTLDLPQTIDIPLDTLHVLPPRRRKGTKAAENAIFQDSRDDLEAYIAKHARTDKHETSADGMIDKLRKELNEALVVSAAHESGKFLPPQSLKQILTRSAVLISLWQIFEARTKAEQLLSYIFSEERNYIFSEERESQSLKIYGILILVGKASEIEKFAEGRITDRELPLPPTVNRSREAGSKSSANDEKSEIDTALAFLMNWDHSSIDLFNVYQWYFLSPCFAHDADGSILHYSLQDNVVLPWIEMTEGQTGGHGIIYRVKIPPSNHQFPCGDEPDVFAVKMLFTNDKDDFAHEGDILQSLSNKPRVVNLLATFQYRNKFFFILQWAAGGSLRDMWRQYEDAPPLRVALPWFMDQAHALAQGLRSIHSPHKSFDIGILHGDLKPDNVLVFRRDVPEGEIGGLLKITDFGSAQRIMQQPFMQGPNITRGFSRTYRAPEIHMMDQMNGLSLKYDIWGLGCTYLEMICWLFLGREGVEDFATSRVNEDRGIESGYQIKEDKYFVDGSDSPLHPDFAVKKCVTELISRLKDLPTCPSSLKAVLTLIQEDMLVVDPSRRLSAKFISVELNFIMREAGLKDRYESTDEGFAPFSSKKPTAADQFRPFEFKRRDHFDSITESQRAAARVSAVKLRLPALKNERLADHERFTVLHKAVSNHLAQEPALTEELITSQERVIQHSSLDVEKKNHLVPVDVKTIDEFVAEVANQKETQRFTLRRTVERRHLWNMQKAIREVAMQDGGKRYAAFKDDFSGMTGEELTNMRTDLYTRIAAVDSLLVEQLRAREQKGVEGTAKVKGDMRSAPEMVVR